jgi:hypothetical protein
MNVAFDARHFSQNVLPTSENREARDIASTAYESHGAAARMREEVSIKCGFRRGSGGRERAYDRAKINSIRTENITFVEYDFW